MTYAVGQRDGEDVLLLTMEGHILAFDSRVQAEDFSMLSMSLASGLWSTSTRSMTCSHWCT